MSCFALSCWHRKSRSAHRSPSVRVLTASRNRGKGGAVRLGMFSARGAKLLFADADGATTFRDIERLEKKLEETLWPLIPREGHLGVGT